MFIANKLKHNNIVAFLLYMWQVEDVLRANDCDMDKLKATYLPKFKVVGDQATELERWYAELIDMMLNEGKREKGHLQINQNIITLLTDLHLQLLASPKFPYYSAAYYKALPYIVELRSKGENAELPEIENCFDMLYGITLLRMQGKEITESTQKAVTDVTAFLSMLADYYKKDKEKPIEF